MSSRLVEMYNVVCSLTKQVLLGKITKERAEECLTTSYHLSTLPVKNQALLLKAFATLMRHAEMPKIAPTLSPEIYTPQIKISNPDVKRGFSVVCIDSQQARKFIFSDARCAVI